MKLNNMTSLLVKSVAALAVSTSMSFAGVSGKAPIAPPPPVEEPAALFDTIGATLSVGYDTRNYYRGLWFNDDSVWVDLNVDIPLTEQLMFNVGMFYLDSFTNAPGNFGVGPGGSFAPFDYSELDIYAGLSYDLGFGTLGLGFTQYFFPNGFSGTTGGLNSGAPANQFGIQSATEIGATFGTSFFGFDWDIGYYYDFRIGGNYAETNLSYEIPVTPWMSLVPAYQLGWGNNYYSLPGAPLSGITHHQFTLSAPIALTPTTSLTPYVSWIIEGRARATQNATNGSEIFAGVSLSVSF